MVEATLISSVLHPNAFGIAWVLLLLSCLVGLLKTRRPSNPAVAVNWCIAFGPLLMLSLVSVFFFNLSLSRVEVLEVWFGGAIMALGLRPSMRQIDRLGLMAATAGGFAAIAAAYSLFIDGDQRAGMSFHPINFGVGCGILLIILTAYVLSPDRPKQPKHTSIFAFGAIASLSGLLASGSRGPILAFLLCILPAALIWTKNSRHIRLGAILLLAFFGLAALFIWKERVRIELIGSDWTSHSIRWKLLLLTLNEIQARPFLGIGADQAGKFFSQFQEPIGGLNHAHNTMLNLALELGVFGGLAWILAFLVIAIYFLRSRHSGRPFFWQTGLVIAAFIFACSMTQDLMSHTFTRRLMTFTIVFFLILSTAELKHKS